MLRKYAYSSGKLVLLDMSSPSQDEAAVVWFDLLNPTAEEDRVVELELGISIPSRDEMQEIEPSARLYRENGAEFMTMTAVTGLDGEEPTKTPITFIIKGQTLVTVRYAEPKPFTTFAARAQQSTGARAQQSTEASGLTGELVMLGLMEVMIDRLADALERIGNEIDVISREVFRNKSSKSDVKTRDLQSLIEQIGRKGDFLSVVQECLVSIVRLVTYHISPDREDRSGKDGRQWVKMIQRDASSLGDHARFLSSKNNFLLDATLGLINLEQNQIVKIFSVAAVVFLPPTLIASIYGMNFEYMPELQWTIGYPLALGLMVLSAVIPYLYFKRRGWL